MASSIRGPAWAVLLADTLTWLATGVMFPFLMLYWQRVHQQSAAQAGMLVALVSLAGVLATPLAGSLTDRLGSRATLLGGLGAALLGAMTMAVATTLPLVLSGAVLVFAGQAVVGPAVLSALALLLPAHLHSNAFSLRATGLNAGIGVGALLGGVIVHADDLTSFARLFWLQALLLLLAGGLASRLPRLFSPSGSGARGRGGWRTALRDPRLLLLCALMFAFVFIGISQLNTGIALVAMDVRAVPTGVFGAAVACNAFVIVLGQVAVTRALRGRRRTSALRLMFLVWVAAWLAVLFLGTASSGLVVPLLVLGMLLFGLGELLMPPSLTPLVAVVAPGELLGRYNALVSLSGLLARTVAPLAPGVLLSHSSSLFAGVMVLACLACLTLPARLHPRLNDADNLIQ
ncbi:MFS transporter [Deinococcus deserti]|uniref:Putative major facilitator superfamily MFS_1 putative membrane protein n=1 Tax=Deinococcus deserti (strain DSM 17065 / CIP 109153 / LMG 22923 / VCD115) TaxID=546414 RepID=C1D484_DEIDV|nr:MFS transporter [Deinococcus deserti]ACO47965.1 putative major facilitator superfamily MFS_1; putative membrane protein [Deinococcus deserti VCD115]